MLRRPDIKSARTSDRDQAYLEHLEGLTEEYSPRDVQERPWSNRPRRRLKSTNTSSDCKPAGLPRRSLMPSAKMPKKSSS